MSHLLVWLKSHLHGANIFLAVLIAATLANSFLSIRTVDQSSLLENTTFTFRVLNRKPDNYNRQIYYVWANGTTWLAQSPKSLQIGYEYTAQGNLSTYDFSSKTKNFEQSALSLGVSGYFKISKTISQNTNCDLICSSFGLLNETRRYAESAYLSGTCKNFLFIIKIFAPVADCRDIFALSYGLVLGGTDKFSPEVYGQIKNLGLTHLVAVSGFQVVLVITFLEALSLRLHISRRWRLMVVLLGIIGLILIVGPQPPVLRSSVSVLLSISVLAFLGRKVNSFRSLIYSGIILLWLNPLYLNSISFQLSFLASLGLILASKRNNSEITLEWLKNYRELSVTSIATFLMTLPIIIKLSGQVTLLGIVTNILVLPFIPVVSILNILGLIPLVGQIPLAAAVFLQSLLVTFIHELSALPLSGWLSISLGEFSTEGYLSYYCFLFLASFWYKNSGLTIKDPGKNGGNALLEESPKLTEGL